MRHLAIAAIILMGGAPTCVGTHLSRTTTALFAPRAR
jgi:hypothetical protein